MIGKTKCTKNRFADHVSNVESHSPMSFSSEYEPDVQGCRVEGRLFASDKPQGQGNRLEGQCRPDHEMQVFRFHRRIGISGFNCPYAVDTVRKVH